MWVGAALACAVAGTRAWPGGAVCARRAAGAGGARYAAFLSRGGPGPTALVERAWAGRGRLRSGRQAHPIPSAGLCSPELPAGVFRGPDRCCREHDQCSAQIMALQFNYGIRNYRLHTVFHCDCDARCRYGVVPLARMVQQRQYHYSLPTEGTGSPAVQPPGKGGKFSRAGHKQLRQGLSQNLSSTRHGHLLQLSSRRVQVPYPPHPPGTRLSPQAGLGRVCKSYEHLDKCKHQIVPSEVKYQLHNMDTWMLFHCNCTRRCVSRRKRQGSSHPGTMCT
uniref:Phospholipase A2 group III n=1 Tax=Strigops habroptila TaxID=2489341 RepID=A0A672U2A5_STRHB